MSEKEKGEEFSKKLADLLKEYGYALAVTFERMEGKNGEEGVTAKPIVVKA